LKRRDAPLEPEIVHEADRGSVEWMESEDVAYTECFRVIVDEVVDLTKQ
jgi:hypothetical protein